MSHTLFAEGSTPVVFRADFSRSEDADLDGWPDGWSRRTDRDFPAYVDMRMGNRSEISLDDLQSLRRVLTQWKIGWEQGKLPGQIIPESVPSSIDSFLDKTIADGCFDITTNGGGAHIESPTFPINPKNSYRLGAEWMCEFTHPYSARLSLIWLDESETILEEIELQSSTASHAWKAIKLEETQHIPAASRFARLRIVMNPETAKSIHGKVRIDRFRVERIPRVELTANPVNRIVRVDDAFEITCHLNEIDPTSTRIQLRAVDQNGSEFWKTALRNPAYEANSSERSVVSWKASLPKPGFYYLSARIVQENGVSLDRVMSFVVINRDLKEKPQVNSMIGLSIPKLGNAMQIEQVPAFFDFINAGAVKFSIWLADDSSPHSRKLGWMVDRLAIKGVQSVGVIDPPPSVNLREQFPSRSGDQIANLLDYPKIWQPLYDPILRKTALFLTQYQLGWDEDASMEGHSRRHDELAAVNKQLRSAGGEGKLTIPWNIFKDIPPSQDRQNRSDLSRVLLRADCELTAAELEVFNRTAGKSIRNNWLLLQPLDRNVYSLHDRVHDLARRMVVASQQAWETIWLSDIHDEVNGILEPNGGPGELLLPIKFMAGALSQSSDFRQVQLTDELIGYLFRSSGIDKLIVFPNRVGEIGLYLGGQWTAMDVWGREVSTTDRVVSGLPTRFIAFENWPVIFSNVDRSLVLWQQEVVIENPTIENRIGLSEPVRLKLANPSEQTLRGSVEIVAPTLLQDDRSEATFIATPGKPATVEVPMQLRYDAGQNQEPIDIVVQLQDKPPKSFLVHRKLLVGLKDFQIESQTYHASGKLVIDLEMYNLGLEASSFECTLIIPDRRREKFQVLHLRDRMTKRLVLADGESLRGQALLLRCEEIGTARVVNHRIAVE
jgi:hypothetical protein